MALLPPEPAWALFLQNALTATPALDGNRGYFPIEGDRLAAYDIEHGTLLWLAPIGTRLQPAVGDRRVFIVEANAITALRDDTGTVAWRYELEDQIGSPLTWDNHWLIATTTSGSVLAFRAQDGGLIWRQNAGASIQGRAALAADRIYLPMQDGRILALRVDTGETLWERRLGGPANDILALDDRLFTGSSDKYFYAIGAKDGRVLWRWPTGGNVVGLPAVDENRVYFVSFDNVLRAHDRGSGNQRWQRPLPLRPTRGPLAVDDLVIASGVSAKIAVFIRQEGNAIGAVEIGGELAAQPHVIRTGALPMFVVVTRDIARGTIVLGMRRAVNPAVKDFEPLPNAISLPTPAPQPTS